MQLEFISAKSTFAVDGGGGGGGGGGRDGGPQKANENKQGERVVRAICMFAL